jgi:hypothetical protein
MWLSKLRTFLKIQTDKDAKRQGKWTIFINKNFDEVSK